MYSLIIHVAGKHHIHSSVSFGEETADGIYRKQIGIFRPGIASQGVVVAEECVVKKTMSHIRSLHLCCLNFLFTTSNINIKILRRKAWGIQKVIQQRKQLVQMPTKQIKRCCTLKDINIVLDNDTSIVQKLSHLCGIQCLCCSGIQVVGGSGA